MLAIKSGLRLYRRPLLSRTFAVVSNKKDSPSSFETNKRTETNRLEKTLARFWEKVTLEELKNGEFAVKLDNKTIKTPLGNNLTISKDRKSLAYLLLNEWKSLSNLKINPYLVPLTSLVSRCIDVEMSQNTDDLEIKAKIGDLSSVKKLLLKYLDTDTLLVFSPVIDCDGDLRKEQEETYRPLIKVMEDYFTKFADDKKQVSLTYLDCEKDGLIGNRQTAHTRGAVMNFLNSLDIWQLIALEKATLTCRSFLCGVAIVRNNDYNDSFNIPVETLTRLATLETVLQTKTWGEVEDTHDVDKVDVKRNLASAAIIAFKSKN